MRNLAAKRVKDRFGRFKLAAKGGEVRYRSRAGHVLITVCKSNPSFEGLCVSVP